MSHHHQAIATGLTEPPPPSLLRLAPKLSHEKNWWRGTVIWELNLRSLLDGVNLQGLMGSN